MREPSRPRPLCKVRMARNSVYWNSSTMFRYISFSGPLPSCQAMDIVSKPQIWGHKARTVSLEYQVTAELWEGPQYYPI